ncbi:MAG: acyloxyacyl hydrolase [Pseudomonadota bacterium]
MKGPSMRILAILLLTLLPFPALAGELSFGLGAVGLDDDAEAGGFIVELRAEPFYRVGPAELRFGSAVELDTHSDLWLGAGVVVLYPFAEAWRVEASFMPGLYTQGTGLDLGHTVEFRSLIGLSRRVAPETWLGVSISHKSNAGIDDTNPGEEAVFLHFTRRF